MKLKSYNLLIIVSVIFIFFSFNSLYEFVELPEELYLIYLPVVLAMQFLYWLLVTITWKVTVKGATDHSIPLTASLKQCISVIVGKYIPGKFWGVIARVTQLKEYHIGYHDSISLSYLELIFGLHAGLTLSIFCIGVFLDNPIYYFISILTLLPILVIPKFNKYLFMIIEKMLHKFFNKDLTFSTFSFSPRTYLYIYFFYIFDWIFLALIQIPIYLFLFNKTPDISLLFLILAAQTTSIIIGFFAFFIPGGIGVRESIFSLIMSSAIPLPEAVLLSICYRLWSMVADMSLVLVNFILPKK